MFLVKKEILREKQIKHYDIEVLVRRPNWQRDLFFSFAERGAGPGVAQDTEIAAESL
jgi:hypothetical protein